MKGANTPSLINCLAIKEVGVAVSGVAGCGGGRMWMWQEVGWRGVEWQGVELRRSEGATTPLLINCLEIKLVGGGSGWGWHRLGRQGMG